MMPIGGIPKQHWDPARPLAACDPRTPSTISLPFAIVVFINYRAPFKVELLRARNVFESALFSPVFTFVSAPI